MVLVTKHHNAVLDSSPVGSLQSYTQILQSVGGGGVLLQVVLGYPVVCSATHSDSDMMARPDRSLQEKPGYNLS